MKRIAAVMVLAVFATVPVAVWAHCGGEHDDSAASAAPAATVAAAPAATKSQASAVKAAPAKTQKKVAVKQKSAPSDAKIAATSTN